MRDLRNGIAHARVLDIAHPQLGRFRGQHRALEHIVQAALFDVLVDQGLVDRQVVDAGVNAGHAFLEGDVDGFDQAADRLGVFFEQLVRHQHAVAVEIQAVVVVKDPADVFVGINVLRHQVHIAGGREHR